MLWPLVTEVSCDLLWPWPCKPASEATHRHRVAAPCDFEIQCQLHLTERKQCRGLTRIKLPPCGVGCFKSWCFVFMFKTRIVPQEWFKCSEIFVSSEKKKKFCSFPPPASVRSGWKQYVGSPISRSFCNKASRGPAKRACISKETEQTKSLLIVWATWRVY